MTGDKNDGWVTMVKIADLYGAPADAVARAASAYFEQLPHLFAGRAIVAGMTELFDSVSAADGLSLLVRRCEESFAMQIVEMPRAQRRQVADAMGRHSVHRLWRIGRRMKRKTSS
jgi:hypothetical protein